MQPGGPSPLALTGQHPIAALSILEGLGRKARQGSVMAKWSWPGNRKEHNQPQKAGCPGESFLGNGISKSIGIDALTRP